MSVAPTFLNIKKKIFINIYKLRWNPLQLAQRTGLCTHFDVFCKETSLGCEEVGVGKLSKQKAWLQHLGIPAMWYPLLPSRVDGILCLICHEGSPVCYVLSMIKIMKGTSSCCCCCLYSCFFFQLQWLHYPEREEKKVRYCLGICVQLYKISMGIFIISIVKELKSHTCRVN